MKKHIQRLTRKEPTDDKPNKW